MKFLQCQCHCWCCADSDFQDNDLWYNVDVEIFKQPLKFLVKAIMIRRAKVQRTDWYSSKENRVRNTSK